MWISEVWAQEATRMPSQGLMQILPLVVIFVIFYFLMLRPQLKKQKEHRKLLESLQSGDEVVLASGIMGQVRSVEDNIVMVEIAPNVNVQVQKTSIQAVLPKGTLKLK